MDRARTPFATATVVVLCLATFGCQMALSFPQEMALVHAAAVVPQWLLGEAPRPQEAALLPVWLTPLTATFLHLGLVHLSTNLLWLVLFGPRIERVLGTARTALLMLLCTYGGMVFQAMSLREMTVVGASGITGSILGAALVLRPKRLLRVPLWPSLALPLPAIFLLVGWFALDLVSALRDVVGAKPLRVAYPLHLAGFLLGAGCAALLRPRSVPLFDKGQPWFSLEEWDPDAPARSSRTMIGGAVLAGLYFAVAAAALLRGRL
jgi:membrane associated rhomboid family serine protease